MKLDDDFNTDWKLDGPWGGEDRLKTALLGQSSAEEDTYIADDIGCFGCFGKNKDETLDHDHPKVRSKAGYWMSDEKEKRRGSNIKEDIRPEPSCTASI